MTTQKKLDMVFPGLVTGVAVLLLLGQTFFSFFEDTLIADDLQSVFLNDNCMRASTQTMFVWSLLSVLFAGLLIKSYTTPLIFGSRWQDFSDSKKRKMVGNVVKFIVRASITVQLVGLVAPQFSFAEGLFSDFNVKEANARLVMTGEATTCAAAGASLVSTAALRTWVFSRDCLMAVMVWELVYIPEISLDLWLHHIYVIIGVTLGTDAMVLGQYPAWQPFVDGLAFLLVLGASVSASVEACVFMYHVSAPNANVQANWMLASIVMQICLICVFFIGLPLLLIIKQGIPFGIVLVVVITILAFLVVVECRLVLLKRAIVAHARQKACVKALGTKDMQKEASANVHDATSESLPSAQGELVRLPSLRRGKQGELVEV